MDLEGTYYGMPYKYQNKHANKQQLLLPIIPIFYTRVCVLYFAMWNSLIFANKITERKLKNKIYGKDTQAIFGLILLRT